MTQEASNWVQNHKILVVIVAVLALALISSSFTGLSITGSSFNQGTQGLNFNFATVQDPSGTEHSVNTQAIDYEAGGGPTIGGSIGSFTVDSNTVNNKVYTWELQNGTTEDQYQANLVQCEMSFDIFESGTGSQAGPINEGFLNTFVDSPTNYNNYNIWIKITPQSSIPFADNPNQFAIAPAYIGLSQSVNWGIQATGGSGAPSITVAEINGAEETSPMAQGDIFPIYYAIGGQSVPLSQTITFEGQPLSQTLFQNQYYIELNIQKLVAVNSYGWEGLTGHNWAFPTGTFNLIVYVWLIGEWTTSLQSSQIPVQVQHATQFGSSPTIFNDLATLAANLLNPFGNLSWIVWVMVLAVAAIFAYYFLVKKKNNSEEGKSFTKNKYFGLTLFNWGILAFLIILDAFDISIFPLDIATDVGTLGYLFYVWKKRDKSS
jgi:hypothetical protein